VELLEKVLRLEQEAEQFGFRWETADQIVAQIESELEEIREHMQQDLQQVNASHFQEEIGDLLHAVFSLSVFCQFNPRETLEKTLIKFERRLNAVKQIADEQGLEHLDGHSFDVLMTFWKQAKERVG
jgi:uncharacterized protein YabN with tetrapyrrole methylase and pyrophosphatase domain